MRNLYLSSDTSDLVLEDYNLKMTSTLSEYVGQKITNLLRTFQNEWFLDRDLGIPYYERILLKNVNLDDVNSIFIEAVSNIEEVDQVVDFETSFDNAERTYKISFKVVLTDSAILESEVSI